MRCFPTGILIAGAAALSGCKDASPQSTEAVPSIPAAALRAEGSEVYEVACALCHYAGEGSALAPDLKGSPVLAGPPEETITIILRGRQNQSVVNGKRFNGIMPKQDTLTDREIAAVVAYVRDQFAGKEDVAQPADVAAMR